MQTLEQFKSSLPEGLTPEERSTKIEEFAESIQNQYVNLQSKADKDMNFTKDVLEESKKVWADSNYILTLIETKPEVAKAIVDTRGTWVSIEDIKSGKVKIGWDAIDERLMEHDRKKDLEKRQDDFEKSVWFTEEEIKTFRTNLSTLSAGKKLTSQEQKQLMVGIAFEMGKPLYSDKNQVIAQNNMIPNWGTWSDKWSSEYKPNDPYTTNFLQEMGVLKPTPKK